MEEITLTGGTLLPTTATKRQQVGDPLSNQVDPSKLLKLVPQEGGPAVSQQQQHHQHHHHHHHGGHSHNHTGQPQPNVQTTQWQMMTPDGKSKAIPMPASAMSLMVPTSEVLKGSFAQIMQAVNTLIRLGNFEKWQELVEGLQTREDISDEDKAKWWLWTDKNGHCLLHWAAKRGDDKRFVQYFCNKCPAPILDKLLHKTSDDATGMTPLHWACTEPGAQSLGILSLLLKANDQKVNLEVLDKSGCTPLLIASQYGQVEVVAYLLQLGANLLAMDSSYDTVLHWAAYKGSMQVCGLILYRAKQQANSLDVLASPDAFGQGPLHLAALRGHTSVVRYLLQQVPRNRHEYKDMLLNKDKNGRSPLELAIHKQRPTVAMFLREAGEEFVVVSNKSRMDRLVTKFRKYLRQALSTHAWKMWLGLADSSDEMDEAPKFPYYYLWANGCIHALLIYPFIFAPVFRPGDGLLWDLPFWHVYNVSLQLICVYTLCKVHYSDPGIMDDRHPQIHYWRSKYEETLESFVHETNMMEAIKKQPLCHTTHIARPLRSKYCRILRNNVLMFDHHCPFVGNTIGLYNYPYFYVLILCLTLSLLSFWINMILYVSRSPETHWIGLTVGIFLGLHIFPAAGLTIYHTQLCLNNLTTNEHINLARYDYLYTTDPLRPGECEKSCCAKTPPGGKRYRNPWNRGGLRNFMDRLSPTDSLYLLSSDLQQQQRGRRKHKDEEMRSLISSNV